MHYRPEIDGLRAVAVAAVIATHAGVPLPGGFLGVDLFFVISGFLITTILLREIETAGFSLAGFYERRARRILPALIFVVVACLPAAWILMTPDQFRSFGQGLVALSFFASNILFWQKSGYFSPAAEENPLIHTWSLGVEEQFYVLFPLGLLLLLRTRARVWLWIAVVAAISLALAEFAARSVPQAAFYLLPFRAWELLAGVLCALAARHERTAGVARTQAWNGGPALGQILALGGLGLIAFSLLFLHSGLSIPGVPVLLPVAGASLVILFATRDTFAGRLLSAPVLVGLGLISYSAYLWHQPLFAFARLAHFDPPPPWMMALLTVLTVGLSWLTWRFVERPFRSRTEVPLRHVVGGGGIACATAIAMGLGLHLSHGLGSVRFAPETLALFETATPAENRSACHGPPTGAPMPDAACNSNAAKAPTWAVFGDSHAVEIAQALGRRLDAVGESITQLSASGCPPAMDFDTDVPGCTQWITRNVRWLETAETAETVETVVLVWRHSAYLFGKNSHSYPGLPDRPYRIRTEGDAAHKRETYWRSFASIAKRLADSGRRVIVVAPVPEIARDIGKYVLRRDSEQTAIPSVSRAYYNARNLWVLDRLAGLAGEVDVLYAADALCDAVTCYGAEGGTAFYFDDNHLSVAGAERVIAPLFDPHAGHAPAHLIAASRNN